MVAYRLPYGISNYKAIAEGNYASSKELLSLPNLKKWVIIFANDKCVLNLEVR